LTGKLIRLIQKCEVGLSQTILRRLYRRAIFEVKVSVEEMRLRWQQRSAGNMPWNGILAEGITWTDLPPRLHRKRQSRFLPNVNLRNQIGSLLSYFAPKAMNLTVTEADRICNHVFDLLGSGPTPLGEKIDWHTDFKTGHRWNPRTYYKRIRPAPYPGGYDIKVPWELSRCQHFVRLGQAYWITGDEKYAQEFVAQVTDWIESNPWPWGVNWACTMDVAIRAVNWLWGYAFFRDSPCLTDQFLETLWRSLLIHGRHIYRNLENQGGFTNNHYLADLVGLIHLGILCPEFKEASEWRDFGLRELWKEMFVQVYPDGVSFEASIPYHRLATEFFLYTVILCQRNDIPVPDEVMAHLEKILEFVVYYTKPDGTVPLIGDGDNGRLLRLKVWDPPEREWVDHRYLLGIGAVLFGRQDFSHVAGDQWEEAIWLLGELTVKLREGTSRVGSLSLRVFPEGGLYILRQPGAYMILRGGTGDQEAGNWHKHNDMLSFEFFADGASWIIDPGTYAYTADFNARHLFRSTGYHNTPRILCAEAVEQNRSSAREPFHLHRDAYCAAAHINIEASVQCVQLELRDYGGRFIRLQRTILAHRVFRTWIIQDRLMAPVDCSMEVNLRLAHAVMPESIEEYPGTYVLCAQDRYLLCYCFTHDAWMSVVFDGWVSPSYGVRHKALALTYRSRNGLEDIAHAGLTLGLLPLEANTSDHIRMAVDKLTSLDVSVWLGPKSLLVNERDNSC